ncbi:MAG: chitin deacetylase [Rhodospirillaceae bacterium]|nr:chitin deacetylase [Rhodospirillaceae bacterium]
MRQNLTSGIRIFFSAIVVTFCFNALAEAELKESSAVILVYHRFGESTYSSSNIRLEQFRAHVNELKKSRYKVLPLSVIIANLYSGKKLPNRTVGLTVDDAYESFFEHAWPLLKSANFPVTLFISTDVVDRRARGYMSWEQIRKLKSEGVTIGSQTKSHKHLPSIALDDVKIEIDKASSRITAELGSPPDLLAYPYGEYSSGVRNVVVDRKFRAAFTQSSGVISSHLDRFALPRFALNERYGGIDRFRLIINALPMMVKDILPRDPYLGENPPAFGFTVTPSIGSLERLACFASNEGKLRLERLGRRVEVRLQSPLPPGRSRVNCTMPGPDNRWRWFGVQFTVPK